jgi:hypothetical protein
LKRLDEYFEAVEAMLVAGLECRWL